MGVNDLWQILEPIKQHISLQDLGGKTIAVDLSLWVCEAQTVKKMIGTVIKPHLRNLFFRISYLTQLNVKLVFVMEGEPPKLKADVMSKRNQTRYGSSAKACSQKTGRSHFKSVLKECLEMLDYLGIPWVQAAGEAEAMCAYLNTSGHVDGCLTNDGDAFLYGAQTVYRNFTMNTKDPHVDCYSISSIKSKLGLDRDALVGLAILLGCDYLPKGVPGVGKEQALKLTQTLKGQSLLLRFNQWVEEPCCSLPQPLEAKRLPHCSVCAHPGQPGLQETLSFKQIKTEKEIIEHVLDQKGSPKDHERNGCKLCKSDRYCEPHDYEYCCPCEWHQTELNRQLSGLENNIKKKACSCRGFPFHEVIQEFLLNKDKMVKPIMYRRPDLLLFQRFTLEKMEWPNHYACEKLLVLLTRYDLIDRKLGRKNSNQLQPIRIVKPPSQNWSSLSRDRMGKARSLEHYAMEDTQPGELTVLTIEEKSLFEAAYPEMVAAYQKQQAENKGKKQKSMKMKPKGNNLTESDDVINFQSFMTLKPTCKIFSEQNTKINLGISSDPILPQEPISPSLNNLAYPEDAPCLNLQEQFMPYPRPLTVKQIKDVSKSLISECSQPSTSSHNNSGIANLHLSSIDWEGTSFSNSPAVQRNTFSHDPPLELESEPSAILHGFEKIPEHLCESEQHPTNCHGKLDGNLQQISHEEHLLPGIAGLCLQDLPLKERIRIKSTYPQYNVQPEVDLKILSLLKVKGSYIADSSSDGSSHLSKDLPGMHLHQESRNPKVLKDQLLQKTFEVNASIPYFLKNSVVKTSSVQVEPPNSAVHHSTKADMKTSKKIVMKNSVCLERDASDEESAPIFGKAKYTAPKMKHSSVIHNPAQHKESDHNKFSNPKIDSKKTELCFQSCKTTENEEHWFSDSVKRTQLLLQSPKKNEDSGTCLDSPLPLCQRLKLRFQNT